MKTLNIDYGCLTSQLDVLMKDTGSLGIQKWVIDG
jgi:hypothetical protein